MELGGLGLRNRSFILAVAAMTVLAAMIMIQNVREARAPLYGAPNVDRSLVMRKVSEGSLSFTEARFYSVDDPGGAPTPAGGESERAAEPGAAPGPDEAPARGGGARDQGRTARRSP
jgi:hypothetical protein